MDCWLRRGTATVLTLATAALPALAPGAALAQGAARPALVVLVAVDQLRRDRFTADLPGGIGRIAREGRVFSEGALDHATTETCPGHLSMLTGSHPGPAGAPTNVYVDPKAGERRYCVEDRAPDAAVLGEATETEPEDGRSPRGFRVDALGDWMRAADPRSKVFVVSGKDRAAIALGGQRPTGVFWYQRGDAPRFTTSGYYATALPDWAEQWHAVPLEERVPEEWVHPTDPVEPGARPDDFPGESKERRRTSPHPVHDRDAEDFGDNVYRSPFLDALTLSFTRALLGAEALGEDDAPDLLAVSLSATDTVGHHYGPESLESRDTLLRLDADLGELLAWLEERVGRDRLLVAFTSDHGVLALPEWLAKNEALDCPVEDGRIGIVSLVAGLYWELYWELSPWSLPRPWVHISSQLTVNRDLARDHEIPVERVVAVAEQWLEARPGVREAWTRTEIERGTDEIARLYRNSLDPEKSGDIALQLERGCILDLDGDGTTHGTPYAYDRDVPIAFWGAGVTPGSVPGKAATVDLAVTLARRLGLEPPTRAAGRDLLAPAAYRPAR